MSFLDKVTKAVSDTVDRGRKEVDEFMRIQKIKGEIGEVERKMQESANQILQIKAQIGGRTVEMLRAGQLASPDLQALADPIPVIERQIEAHAAVVAEKKAEIERIKAEDAAPKPAPASAVVVPDLPVTPAPTFPPPIPDLPPIPVAPPATTSADAPLPRLCTECGKPVAEAAAFCTECGAKMG
jgi:hypothetical protein